MTGQAPCPRAMPGAYGPDTAEIHAAPTWRCIDFISDLHLHAGRPLTFQAFRSYLLSTPAQAVFILGDLFEAWVGDDMRHEPFEAQCVQTLAQASRSRCLYLMVGNRDFLMGAELARDCGAQLIPDPTVLDAFGARHLLTHGDAWCVEDTEYQAFRQRVRHPSWQAQFLSLPLPSRLDTARGLREASEARKGIMTPESWADVDPEHAAEALTQAQASQLIHGHTHQPASGPFAKAGCERHVLSDWELDHGGSRAEVLRIESSGVRRLPLGMAGSPGP